MVWINVSPEQNEPIENRHVRLLKQRLANITCKHYQRCHVYPKEAPVQALTPTQLEVNKNKQVQVNGFVSPMGKCIEILSLVFPQESSGLNKQNDDSNLQINTLILKDEELETDKAMFYRDEGTENSSSLLDSSTSVTDNTSLKYSVLTHCDLSKCRNVALCRNYKTKLIPDEMVLETFMDSIRPPLS